MARKQTLSVGDKVGYAAKFLKQVGASWEIASMRGVVKEVKTVPGVPFRVLTVLWSDGTEGKAREEVLARVGTVQFCDPSA